MASVVASSRVRAHALRSLALLALALAAPVLVAQQRLPEDGGHIPSIGHPPTTWLDYTASAGRHGPTSDLATYATLGAQRYKGSAVIGLMALRGEAYAGFRRTAVDGGVRGLRASPILGLHLGLDYNLRDGRGDFLVGVSRAVRRGGILARGTSLRLDWLPTRGQSLQVGISRPLSGRVGATRPARVDVALPPRAGAPRRAGARPLDTTLVRTADAVRRLVVPFADPSEGDPVRAVAADVAALRPLVATPDDAPPRRIAVRAFHAALEAHLARAIPAAQAGDRALVARIARETLLEHVLLPYDATLGQHRTPDTIEGFGAIAASRFVGRLIGEAGFSAGEADPVVAAFGDVIAVLERMRAAERARWEDGRLVWLPLQYGLLPEDHDEEAELERLVERASSQSFTDGNRFWYVLNEDFQGELTRTVLSTKRWHVLWTHDFRGGDKQGRPDALAYRHVVETYLRALTLRVREYDRTGTLPAYFLFLDEFLYDDNDAARWTRFLASPLAGTVPLPRGYEAWAARIDSAQRELRRAVEGSELLQARRKLYGDAWLTDLVKVHVSITQPADPTFWGPGMVPVLGQPDNLLRDHRKLVLHDLDESDPYAGQAILTGMGVGEEYAGPTWEDRALVVQGPAALGLKAAAAEVLVRNGIPHDELPAVLRSREVGPAWFRATEAEVARRRIGPIVPGRAVILHNAVGYGDKAATVARAVLFTLAPAGTLIKVPDSLWQNHLFGAMLCGAAINGSHVLLVAPALASAPSADWPQMARAHDLLSRALAMNAALRGDIERHGGSFHIGLYREQVGVGDYGARVREAFEARQRTPWLRDLDPLPAPVEAGMVAYVDSLMRDSVRYLVEGTGPTPKLHSKGVLIVTLESWQRLLRRPEMGPVIRAYARQRVRSVTRNGAADSIDIRALSDSVNARAVRLLAAFHAEVGDAGVARTLMFQQLGSANLDLMSMFDNGEVLVTTAGIGRMAGAIDFLMMSAMTQWITTQAELDALVPPPAGWQRSLARWFRGGL
jgi:hypothetical protein